MSEFGDGSIEIGGEPVLVAACSKYIPLVIRGDLPYMDSDFLGQKIAMDFCQHCIYNG
jgi:hypothetical protein